MGNQYFQLNCLIEHKNELPNYFQLNCRIEHKNGLVPFFSGVFEIRVVPRIQIVTVASFLFLHIRSFSRIVRQRALIVRAKIHHSPTERMRAFWSSSFLLWSLRLGIISFDGVLFLLEFNAADITPGVLDFAADDALNTGSPVVMSRVRVVRSWVGAAFQIQGSNVQVRRGSCLHLRRDC